MKRCCTCKRDLSLQDFAKNKAKRDGVSPQCRACKSVAQAAWYVAHKDKHQHDVRRNAARYKQENTRWVVAFLREHPCVDCAEADPVVLEFDHVRGKKLFAISVACAESYALATLQSEIAKCDVRCANCHRKKTAKERNTLRWRLTREDSSVR